MNAFLAIVGTTLLAGSLAMFASTQMPWPATDHTGEWVSGFALLIVGGVMIAVAVS